jgi:nucleotide-binding universal stress UspA family protein
MATVVTGYVPKPEGDAALAAGIEEARRRGARLVVVHAPVDDADAASVAAVRTVLGDAGVEYEVLVPGDGREASDEIVEVAEELGAELIVIGLRRRSPVGKLILGSNAQRVLLDAPCPVLTVKPRPGRS